MKKYVLLIVVSFFLSFLLNAQVGIGTTNPDNSALLELNSNSSGILIPRMTASEKIAIDSPANGLLIYQTDEPRGFYYYDNNIWNSVSELPNSPQNRDMIYWNDSAWVVIPGTVNEGATLQMISGVPTWTGGTPSVINPTTGKIWMDRNLGASQVATSITDAASYGDLYQWGRRADGHEKRDSGTTIDLAPSDTPGNGDFITTSSSPHDWRSPQNDNLWQGVDGINNPCPSGYRLPTIAEWEAELATWSSNNSAGAFASALKLPVAGYRKYSNGSINDVGSGGGYWSSTLSGANSRLAGFNSSNTGLNTSNRSSGFSVRCLKD